MAFQILCLSGGGYFGLYTATVLAALEQKSGRPIAKSFDLIAGTSVGGIIALGLCLEKPAATIMAAFQQDGTKIFSNRPNPRTPTAKARDFCRYFRRPKYSSDGLRNTITSIVGPDTRIGDLRHPVIVPTVNLTKGKPQVFKTPHHQTFERDLFLKVVDVALATSAAPTFFPLAEVGNSLFADGGLYGNSPDLMALHEAEHFFEVPISEVRLLSIGTTTSQFSFSHADGRNYGVLKWALDQKLVQASLSSQQSMVDYMVAHRLGPNYLRIDTLQSREQERDLALDVATKAAQKTIMGLAEGSVQKFIAAPFLNAVLSHAAPPPTFHHPPNWR